MKLDESATRVAVKRGSTMMKRIHENLRTYEQNKAQMGYKFLQRGIGLVSLEDTASDEDLSGLADDQKTPEEILQTLLKERRDKE